MEPVAAAESARGRADAIALCGVWRSYGGVPAVRDVSLAVGPSEFVTLLGPSGSGKTTVLLMIAGFVAPDRGRVEIGGEDATHLPAHHRNIGFVFQHYALFPQMTVQDNVAFPLRVRRLGAEAVRERVRDVLGRLQLDGLGGRLPSQLSGGQQQRVALARALVFEPSVLLMDEPLAALDRQLRQRMQLEIKGLQRALGIPVVYVTHDQEEALVMSDRIAVMNRGRIEQIDPVECLYDRPQTEFVAGFMGEANLLRGRMGARGRVTTASGWALAASGAEGIREGADVLLVVRPERVELAPAEAPDRAAPGDNQAIARVEQVIHAGDVMKYLVRAGGGERVVAKGLNRGGGPRPGDTVRMWWSVDDTRAIDGSARAAGITSIKQTEEPR
jgi:putative spermidine/putrescine transport system ATP-binding protein